jgi:hypothetical protein
LAVPNGGQQCVRQPAEPYTHRQTSAGIHLPQRRTFGGPVF